MNHLQVYVEAGCPGLEWAEQLLEVVRCQFPGLSIEVVDLQDASADVPPFVFASPTYVLNGKVISLGNPTLTQMQAAIESVPTPFDRSPSM